MNYERPQRGNPHQLTVNQHCFPASCIKRFTNTEGRVQLVKINPYEEITAKPDAKIFCVKRAWDENAEHGLMKDIEDKYKKLADDIVNSPQKKLSPEEQLIVTDMFILWNIRVHWGNQPIPNQHIQDAVDVAVKYTKDDEEYLEKNGITCIRTDLTIPGRALTGQKIIQNIITCRQQMNDARWGILRCTVGDFIVPDQVSDSRMLPLTPNIVLFSQSDNALIDAVELKKINNQSISGAKEFYFAKDLSRCLR